VKKAKALLCKVSMAWRLTFHFVVCSRGTNYKRASTCLVHENRKKTFLKTGLLIKCDVRFGTKQLVNLKKDFELDVLKMFFLIYFLVFLNKFDKLMLKVIF
jgi:hypothetical protein